MVLALGVDANKTDVILAAIPWHPPEFPDRAKPSAFDAGGLADLATRLAEYLKANEAPIVAIVSDLSGRTAPRDLKPRVQLETAVMLAARRAGSSVSEVTLGTAMSHLGVESIKGQSRRGQLRARCEAALGADRLSPAPERRASAIGVALAASGLSLEDIA